MKDSITKDQVDMSLVWKNYSRAVFDCLGIEEIWIPEGPMASWSTDSRFVSDKPLTDAELQQMLVQFHNEGAICVSLILRHWDGKNHVNPFYRITDLIKPQS
jgi:hypothetical protein